MDIIEINKMLQKTKVNNALDRLYEPKNLNDQEALILCMYACRKQFGLQKTVKIVHGLGVKNL